MFFPEKLWKPVKNSDLDIPPYFQPLKSYYIFTSLTVLSFQLQVLWKCDFLKVRKSGYYFASEKFGEELELSLVHVTLYLQNLELPDFHINILSISNVSSQCEYFAN